MVYNHYGKSNYRTKNKNTRRKDTYSNNKQTMEDAFELSVSTNLTMAEIQQSRNWFHTKACSIICDHLGTTRDHVLNYIINYLISIKLDR